MVLFFSVKFRSSFNAKKHRNDAQKQEHTSNEHCNLVPRRVSFIPVMCRNQRFVDAVGSLLNWEDEEDGQEINQPVWIWKYEKQRQENPSTCLSDWRDGLPDLERSSGTLNLFKQCKAVNKGENSSPERADFRLLTLLDYFPILVEPIELIAPPGTEIHHDQFRQRHWKEDRLWVACSKTDRSGSCLSV